MTNLLGANQIRELANKLDLKNIVIINPYSSENYIAVGGYKVFIKINLVEYELLT